MRYCEECGSNEWIIKWFNMSGWVYPSYPIVAVCAKCGKGRRNCSYEEFFQFPLAEDFEVTGSNGFEYVRSHDVRYVMCPKCRRIYVWFFNVPDGFCEFCGVQRRSLSVEELREELPQLHDKPWDHAPPHMIEMWTREKEKVKAREKAIVVVDLNKLIQQLSEGGFTISYHCSYCGAPLQIDGETKVEAIKVCSHCGSRIEAIDLARFIESYLS